MVSCVFMVDCGDDSPTRKEKADIPEPEWQQYTVTWFTTNPNVTKWIPTILSDREKDDWDEEVPPAVENQTERARMFDQKSEITAMLGRQFNVVFEMLGTSKDSRAARALSDLIRNGETPDVFTFCRLYRFYLDHSNFRWVPHEVSAEISVEELATHMPEVYMDMTKAAQASGHSLDQVLSWYSHGGKLFAIPVLYSPLDLGYLTYFSHYPKAILWRKDILDELGLPVPRTVHQWEVAFSRYKTRYPDKYPWAWEGDNPIYAATGTGVFGWYKQNGQLRPGYLQAEMRTAVSTVRRWYEYGYYGHPELPRNSFIAGNALVLSGVDYRDGSWICEKPYWPGSIQDRSSGIDPTAEFVITPRPSFSGDRKPCRNAAGPFGLQVIAFGKHLETNRDKLHRIMRIIDSITHDKDLFLLVTYGIEGKHWKWDEIDGQRFPVRLPGAQTTKELNKLNVGEHWIIAHSPLSEKYLAHPRILESRDRLIQGPEAVYSPEQVVWDYSGYRALLIPNIVDDWRSMVGDFLRVVYRGKPVEKAFDEFSSSWEEQYGPMVQRVTRWYAENFE